MMPYLKFSVLIFFLVNAVGFSQDKNSTSRIPIETMLGNRKVNYLAIFNFDLSKDAKLGYFSVMTINAPFRQNEGFNEFVFSNALTYKLANRFFVLGGLQYHFLKGIVPYSGIQFLLANQKWLFVFSPTLAFSPKTSLQTIGIVEYKPRLTDRLKLYTRLQGIYNVSLNESLHERSLLYLRTGITINRLSVGLGFNIDYYGPGKTRQENIGIFIHHLF